MPNCGVCGQDKSTGEEKKIYTARVLKEERGAERMVYGGGREVEVTTTYGEFQEHRYFLCASCRTIWDKIAMPVGAGLTVLVSIALGVVALKQHVDWMFALALVVFIGGIIVAGLLSTEEQLKRKAKQERGKTAPIKAFSEQAYGELMHKG